MGKELSSQVLRLTLAISLWLTLAHSSSTLLSLSHSCSLALTRAYFDSLYSSLCLYLAFARHATSLLHNCSLSSPDSGNSSAPNQSSVCFLPSDKWTSLFFLCQVCFKTCCSNHILGDIMVCKSSTPTDHLLSYSCNRQASSIHRTR